MSGPRDTLIRAEFAIILQSPLHQGGDQVCRLNPGTGRPDHLLRDGKHRHDKIGSKNPGEMIPHSAVRKNPDGYPGEKAGIFFKRFYGGFFRGFNSTSFFLRV